MGATTLLTTILSFILFPLLSVCRFSLKSSTRTRSPLRPNSKNISSIYIRILPILKCPQMLVTSANATMGQNVTKDQEEVAANGFSMKSQCLILDGDSIGRGIVAVVDLLHGTHMNYGLHLSLVFSATSFSTHPVCSRLILEVGVPLAHVPALLLLHCYHHIQYRSKNSCLHCASSIFAFAKEFFRQEMHKAHQRNNTTATGNGDKRHRKKYQ